MDGKVSAPQVIDQLAGRYGSPQAEQEVSQQGADLCLANLDQPAVLGPGRQCPEHAKTHQVRITGSSGAAGRPPPARPRRQAADRPDRQEARQATNAMFTLRL